MATKPMIANSATHTRIITWPASALLIRCFIGWRFARIALLIDCSRANYGACARAIAIDALAVGDSVGCPKLTEICPVLKLRLAHLRSGAFEIRSPWMTAPAQLECLQKQKGTENVSRCLLTGCPG